MTMMVMNLKVIMRRNEGTSSPLCKCISKLFDGYASGMLDEILRRRR